MTDVVKYNGSGENAQSDRRGLVRFFYGRMFWVMCLRRVVGVVGSPGKRGRPPMPWGRLMWKGCDSYAGLVGAGKRTMALWRVRWKSLDVTWPMASR